MSLPDDVAAFFEAADAPQQPPAHGGNGTGGPARPPLAVSTELDRVVFADGNVIEMGVVTTSRVDESGTVFNEVVHVKPKLLCGCTPESTSDIYACAIEGCPWISCSSHSWTCQACGRTCCSQHTAAVRQEDGSVAVLCASCVAPEPSWFEKLWQWLIGEPS